MRRRGVTWIEVLVILAIIVVLIGLLIPAIFAARDAALRAKEEQQQQQIKQKAAKAVVEGDYQVAVTHKATVEAWAMEVEGRRYHVFCRADGELFVVPLPQRGD